MPQVPQQAPASAQDTRQLLTKIYREFTGVYTRASRTAIPDEYFYNLENLIPIGPQNAHVVNNISGPKINYGGSDVIYASQGVNLNGTEYLVNFATTGKVFYYNIGASTSAQVETGFSGAGSQCCQWNNTQTLFVDSTGYYHYDGTTFAKITGTGVPSSGNSIAVYAGRVWIAQGRVLYVSAVDDYTAAAWSAANGAAALNLTDPSVRSTVFKLIAANGYLYLYSVAGINAISDVYVPSGASPPTPVFTNTNLQPLIGSDQPASVIPYDRNVMFASRYGIHSLLGVDAPKISGDIDGTWQYLDFTQSISAGQVVVANILCAAFLIKRLNDPIFGSNTVIALWFSQSGTNANTGIETSTDVWWFANFGTISLVSSGFLNNVPTLFCFKNNVLYQLFADSTTAPNTAVWTKLYPMEDELADKEILQCGVEMLVSLFGSQLNLYADTASVSDNAEINSPVTPGQWINAAGQQGAWKNAAGAVGNWQVQALVLLYAKPAPMHDRHVGLRLTTVGYQYELHLMAMDYKIQKRWRALL